MKTESNENKVDLTTKGTLVVSMSKALFIGNIDEVFDVLGGYMDEHGLKVSARTIADYEKAGRID
ncbi:MAG: hypothetical protein QM488_18240 [Rhizobiaceae bacterium]